MNAPAGVHFGALPATRTADASADPAGAVAGDLSTSAAGLQQVSNIVSLREGRGAKIAGSQTACAQPNNVETHASQPAWNEVL